MTKKIFIIDAMAMAFRTFYGLGRVGLTLGDGTPVSAVYGTALFLTKLQREEQPDYWVAVNDTKEPTHRHKIFKDYKGHRDSMPDDLAQQLPRFYKLLNLMGIEILSKPGYEADDIIATIAKKYADTNLKAYIVSGDKDFLQLVSPQINLYSPKKNEAAIVVDPAGVMERFGCPPENVIDCLALMGDSADNVPGVPGVGEKTAAKLISEHQSLENVYAHIDNVKGKKLKENLTNFKEQAFLSKELVTLVKNVPIDLDLERWHVPQYEITPPDLEAFYQELEFFSLIKKKAETKKATITKEAPKVLDLTTPEDIQKLIKGINSSGSFAIHTIGDGVDPATSINLKAFIAHQEGKTFSVDLTQQKIQQPFIKGLIDSQATMVGMDLKVQLQRFSNQQAIITNPLFDNLMADYLLDPNNPVHSFQKLAERHYRDLESANVSQQADAHLRIHPLLKKSLQSHEMTDLMINIEMPLVSVLAKMETTGVYLDASKLNSLSKELANQEEQLTHEIHKLAGESFNINSTKQLQTVLFEKLKIHEELGVKRLKKTKTGISTDESVLTSLKAHPLAQLILDYREVTKIKSTYVDSLPQHISPHSGRLHGIFRQNGTATGRLSSDSPNLQNIPMHSRFGKLIRQAFTTSDPDWLMISADYSQIEIRLLAAFSGAKPLMEAFKKGLDIHTATAASVFNLKESEVTPEIRSKAKAVNFGILYGMGPTRLAAETGTNMKEAKSFIAKYYDAFPEIKAYIEGLKESARNKGYSQTIMGRRRPIPGLGDSNKAARARAENIAVNAPIQGSAADLVKVAMINIQNDIEAQGMKTRLLIQIHDELLLECPKSEAEAAQQLVTKHMLAAMRLPVPLDISISQGPNWFQAH